MKCMLLAIVALLAVGCAYEVPDEVRQAEQEAEKKKLEPKDEGIIKRTTREILDLEQARAEHPDWIVIENKRVTGNDPLTQATSARIGIATEVRTFPIQQWVSHERALNDRIPTHADLMRWLEQNPGVVLQARRPYHKYAYDATTGDIVILENPQLKAQIFEEKGIPLK